MNTEEDIWVTSKWTMEQLDGRKVEFWIPQNGRSLHGIGQFLVKQNPAGLLAVTLCTFVENTATRTIEDRLHLPQAAVDRIERHPDQALAHFRLA